MDKIELIRIISNLVVNTNLDWNKVSKDLFEYLRINIKDFDNYFYSDNSTVSFYQLNKEDSESYLLWGNSRVGEIHYLLAKPVNILDALKNNQEVFSFEMHTNNNWGFTKELINNEWAYVESFEPGKKIETKVYDIKKLYKVIDELDYKMTKVVSNDISYIDKPMTMNNEKEEYRIVVNELTHRKKVNEYTIEVYDIDNNLLDYRDIDGYSLYSVYYSYMTLNGYFKENNDINKGNTK